MIRLVVDCFGGDHSPDANVAGCTAALRQFPDLALTLTGDESKINALLARETFDTARLSVVHAPEIITGEEKPTDAIRLKKDSSMMRAVSLLRTHDDLAGLVSIGSTGALVAASVLRLGRLEGVIRPALCPILPTMNGGLVGVCDCGANVECTPDRLQQFAVMGSLYLQNVYGIESPRVALLNVGTETEKGDSLRQATYPLLRETPGINFIGNMESRDLLSGNYNLIVCDGFSGNVLIKSTEGACIELLKRLKHGMMSNLRCKIGALLLRGMLMREKDFLNYQNYGGSVLLGIDKMVVKGHGSSGARAVCKCIEQAYRMTASDLGTAIKERLCALPTAKGVSSPNSDKKGEN